MRHGGRHFLVDRHLLLDGPLHPDEADPELVLEELADRAHAPVAEVIDVVHVGGVPPQLQLILDDLVEVLRMQDLLVERGVQPQLRVQLQAANAREVVLLRVEEHVLEERARAVERRRIAWTQPPVNLDQRLFVGVDRVLLERRREDRADLVALGEEDLERLDVLLLRHRDDTRLDRLVSLEDDLTRRRVHDVRGGEGSFELRIRDLDGFDPRLLQRGKRTGRDLAAGMGHDVAVDRDVLCRAESLDAVPYGPEDAAAAQVQPVHGVEAPDDLVSSAQAQGAEEDGGQELPLPVDADVEQVLRVVLELDPRATVRNDLRDVERLVFRMEEGARRPVELRHDDALGPVDDEGAVVGHQRDVAEVDLLLLDVADRLDAGLGVLVPDHEPDRDLQRHGVGHAALLAFVHVVLELQADGVAADVADVPARLVGLPAARAEHVVLAVRIGDQGMAAVHTRLPQVVQPGEPAALALPVADRVLDELERRVLAEVADGKYRLEHRLQAGVFAFRRQPVHLQEPLVGLLLDLDQVRDRDRRLDLAEVDALAVDVLGEAVHRCEKPRGRN